MLLMLLRLRMLLPVLRVPMVAEIVLIRKVRSLLLFLICRCILHLIILIHIRHTVSGDWHSRLPYILPIVLRLSIRISIGVWPMLVAMVVHPSPICRTRRVGSVVPCQIVFSPLPSSVQ